MLSLLPYNEFISLGANFPKFPELDHNSGKKFILGSFCSSVVGLVLYNCACIFQAVSGSNLVKQTDINSRVQPHIRAIEHRYYNW